MKLNYAFPKNAHFIEGVNQYYNSLPRDKIIVCWEFLKNILNYLCGFSEIVLLSVFCFWFVFFSPKTLNFILYWVIAD